MEKLATYAGVSFQAEIPMGKGTDKNDNSEFRDLIETAGAKTEKTGTSRPRKARMTSRDDSEAAAAMAAQTAQAEAAPMSADIRSAEEDAVRTAEIAAVADETEAATMQVLQFDAEALLTEKPETVSAQELVRLAAEATGQHSVRALSEAGREDMQSEAVVPTLQTIDALAVRDSEKTRTDAVMPEPAHTEAEQSNVVQGSLTQDTREAVIPETAHAAGSAAKTEPTQEKQSGAMLHPEAGAIGLLQKAETGIAEVPEAEVTIAPTPEANFAEQLSQYVGRHLPADNGQLLIELHPGNLGKITISVAYEASRATISILASEQRTGTILAEHAAQMGQILAQTTGEQTEVVVTAGYEQSHEMDTQTDARSQNRREADEHQQQNKKDSSDSFLQMMRLGIV